MPRKLKVGDTGWVQVVVTKTDTGQDDVIVVRVKGAMVETLLRVKTDSVESGPKD